MATLRAARSAYKNSDNCKTDAWFMRIERPDGYIIRITSAAEDVDMTTRVKADGTTEAIGSTVTYFSAAGYRSSAVSHSDGEEAGSLDLEALLDTVSTQTVETRSTKIDLGNISVRASSTFAGTDANNIINDNTSGLGGGWTPDPATPSNTDPAFVEYDFKMPVVFNKIKYYGDENCYLSVRKSDDGMRFDEITPFTYYSDITVNKTTTITLPDTVRSRFIRIYFGTPDNSYDVVETDFYYDNSYKSFGSTNRTDIENGLFENARVYLFLTDYTDPYEDDEKLFAGFINDITLREGTYVAGLISLKDALRYRTGRRVLPVCDAKFGSFRCGINLYPALWTALQYNRAMVTGDKASGTWTQPTSANGYYYYCSVAGTSGGSEPTWPTTPGATVVDGTATWTCVRAFKLFTTVDAVNKSGYEVTINALSGDTAGTWDYGSIKFLDGDLAGGKVTISAQSGSTVTLDQPLRTLPSGGDLIEITMGCGKTLAVHCNTKYGNYKNFQGFPDVPGQKVASKSAKQRGQK